MPAGDDAVNDAAATPDNAAALKGEEAANTEASGKVDGGGAADQVRTGIWR